MTEDEAFDEVCAYTITHRDPAFIHQHVVDSYAAQRADEHTKPIAITFALVGLYLLVERHFTGREVQRVHMKLARRKQVWPVFELPRERGTMTILQVQAAPAGPERDRAIHAWCKSVWEAFTHTRPAVLRLLRDYGVV